MSQWMTFPLFSVRSWSVCYTIYLNVLLHLIYQSPLWSSSFPPPWHLAASFPRYTRRRSLVYSPLYRKSLLPLSCHRPSLSAPSSLLNKTLYFDQGTPKYVNFLSSPNFYFLLQCTSLPLQARRSRLLFATQIRVIGHDQYNSQRLLSGNLFPSIINQPNTPKLSHFPRPSVSSSGHTYLPFSFFYFNTTTLLWEPCHKLSKHTLHKHTERHSCNALFPAISSL